MSSVDLEGRSLERLVKTNVSGDGDLIGLDAAIYEVG